MKSSPSLIQVSTLLYLINFCNLISLIIYLPLLSLTLKTKKKQKEKEKQLLLIVECASQKFSVLCANLLNLFINYN